MGYKEYRDRQLEHRLSTGKDMDMDLYQRHLDWYDKNAWIHGLFPNREHFALSAHDLAMIFGADTEHVAKVMWKSRKTKKR
jgi:hypothetical protein